MRYFWAIAASAGLGLCALGTLGLPNMFSSLMWNSSSAWPLVAIGLGVCGYLFARTWLLVMWRVGQPHRRAAHAESDDPNP